MDNRILVAAAQWGSEQARQPPVEEPELPEAVAYRTRFHYPENAPNGSYRVGNWRYAESLAALPKGTVTESLHTAAQMHDHFAAAKVREAQQWQTIDSAPKDGRCLVLVATDDGPCIERLDRDEKGNWLHEGEPTFCHSYYFKPTHWMPLPAAPKEQQ